MTTENNGLFTVEETATFINEGQSLLISGDETLLQQLPKGNWIGGTMHYFMSSDGGIVVKDKLFINFLDDRVKPALIKAYGPEEMDSIVDDYPASGVSFIIIPALSACWKKYSTDTCFKPEILQSPLVGWISGVIYEEIGKETPKVINGKTGELHDNQCILMHCELAENVAAVPNILNIFDPGSGDVLEFDEETTEVKDVIVNGVKRNFYDYLKEIGATLQEPLMTDYAGAKINTSFFSLNDENKVVNVWSPVLPGYEYKIPSPIANYEEKFGEELEKLNIEPLFACNCLYNFFYGQLEGKKTGRVVGPMTFGEIAYLYLNQTMVYLTLEETAA
ncbi:MAG: hypothetical protein AAF551_05490 [Bacteroidota bacterium]